MFGRKRKSIKDMTPRQIRRHSLTRKVIRSTLGWTIVLGIISMLFGCVLYMIPVIGDYIGEVDRMLTSSTTMAQHSEETKDLIRDVMGIYDDMSEEEREQSGTEEYSERFASVAASENYKKLQEILLDFRDSSQLKEIYLANYDRGNRRIVYICDPGPKGKKGFGPGEWEYQAFGEFERIAKDDGRDAIVKIDRMPDDDLIFIGGMPIRDDDGRIMAFMMGDLLMGSIIGDIARYLLFYLGCLIIIITIILIIMRLHMNRILVRPLRRITRAARDYTEDKQSGRTATDRFGQLDLRTGDEIESLSLVMSDMEQSMNEYEENLRTITAEKERIATELSLAARIQEGMLPSTFPPFPDCREFDLYASMDPAVDVGGDFYDFFMVDEDHLALIIADVSGKGIPASLFMMSSKIIIDTATIPERQPSEILEMVNEVICGNNEQEMFVTVWLGILEISTGRIVAANAGHEKPVILRADGSAELIEDIHGLVIGGMEGMKYRDYELQLQPGDKIFVYTDGVPEATSAKDGLFGTDRMMEAVVRTPNDTAKDVLDRVRETVDEFVGEDEQFDDLTMLCLKYIGR